MNEITFLFHRLTRPSSGSLSLSKDETVIAINNTHNGFNVYCLPHGDLVGRFVEHDLHATATSSFLDSDEFLVYPGGAGVLKLGEIQSTSSLAFVSGAGGLRCSRCRHVTLKH